MYWRGLTAPLPFFPETARAYIASLRKEKSDAEALKAAGRVWAPDRGYAEGQDPYFSFCFDGPDPLGDDFRELAAAVLGPLLEQAVEVR